ncbi:MAG TPA: hypothetical protein VJB57_16710 [Dehalococcoidia bacterium]|nr:hypothetical protein [Dehalococcoidia bacterium]
MEEYLFGPIPEDLSFSGKVLFYVIRLSEGIILFGVTQPWYSSRAFGDFATVDGLETDSGKLIVAVVLIGAVLPVLRPVNEPLSRYAWGLAFVGVVTLLLAYNEATGDPEDAFALKYGIYITMAGGALRAGLGVWLGMVLERYEKRQALAAWQALIESTTSDADAPPREGQV